MCVRTDSADFRVGVSNAGVVVYFLLFTTRVSDEVGDGLSRIFRKDSRGESGERGVVILDFPAPDCARRRRADSAGDAFNVRFERGGGGGESKKVCDVFEMEASLRS